MDNVAKLMGTTPTALKQQSFAMLDAYINDAILKSGKIFDNVPAILANARSLVAGGMTINGAIAQTLQRYGIVPRNEIQV